MENKKFRIALFMLPLLTQGGGAEKYFIDLARNLSEEGYQTDIVTMDENFFNKFARLLHIFALGNFFGKIDTSGREKEDTIKQQLGKALWIKTNFKNLGNILKNYDIVYSKNEIVELVLLRFVSCKKLPPIVLGVHTPIYYPKTKSFISKLHNFLYSGFFYKRISRGAKCVHVSNISAKKIVENKLKSKSELIYYPFSAQQALDSAETYKCGIEFDRDKKNIIFAGRLGEQKGIDVLINIIQKISENEILAAKIGINIFGTGDKKCETVVKMLAEKNSFVHFFGHIENKFMPHVLSQQDLMVAPSKWETLPYSVLEAQGMGLPVIAFDIPGPGDIIEKDKTGFLVSTEDEFFEKLKDIVDGKIGFDKNAIIQNIEKKFSPEKIYKEMINMFEKNIFTPLETGARED
jgi:glycosyltransferase involved in cell wall biosynthesis